MATPRRQRDEEHPGRVRASDGHGLRARAGWPGHADRRGRLLPRQVSRRGLPHAPAAPQTAWLRLLGHQLLRVHLMTARRTIAVVDPVSLAGPYGTAATAMGLDAVAVLTQEFRTPYVIDSFHVEDYSDVHRLTSVSDTISFLKDREVAAVVAGTQTALDVVDLLADGLGLI